MIQESASRMEVKAEATSQDEKCSEAVVFLEETRVIPNLPSVTERYFKHKLFRNTFDLTSADSCEDFIVLAHSNRIKLITLAPTHDLLRLKKTVLRVDFDGEKINRLDNQVSGKWKKGAQRVQKQSILCSIECTDGSSYKVRACLNGKIIEINKKLMEQPHLLTSKPWSDGFVAIILPPFNSTEVDTMEDFK